MNRCLDTESGKWHWPFDCARVFQLHQGTITMPSGQGLGSSFIVQLPVVINSILLPQHEQSISDSLAKLSSGQDIVNKKEKLNPEDSSSILIIEDNEEFRYYLKKSLSPFMMC